MRVDFSQQHRHVKLTCEASMKIYDLIHMIQWSPCPSFNKCRGTVYVVYAIQKHWLLIGQPCPYLNMNFFVQEASDEAALQLYVLRDSKFRITPPNTGSILSKFPSRSS